MKFHSLRSTLAGLAALGAALLLSSCGGGGAGGNPNEGGFVSVFPQAGTFYAGVPATLTLSGGRRPYSLTSSEPGILPVPAIVNGNSVQVIPNNPGVVDPGLGVGDLPRRTVKIHVRDSTGDIAEANITVAQNFLTGYGLILSPVTCPTPQTGSAPTACAGGTTAAQMRATFNGSLHGNRLFRYEVVRGNFSLRDPVTGAAGNSITLRSDHTGTVLGFIEVPAGVSTQLAVIRVIDVETGVYADQVFTISASGANQGRLVTIPSAIKFTGPTTLVCGTGSADVLIFDGTPPYTAVSTNPNVIIGNSPSNTQPGRITILAISPQVCLDASVIIQDATGARATVQVTTEAGATAPAAPPDLVVAPNTISLLCGATGSVSVVGGAGNYSVASTNANVTAAVSGNTIAITRRATDVVASGGVPGGASTVSVTDGAKILTIAVTSPATCP